MATTTMAAKEVKNCIVEKVGAVEVVEWRVLIPIARKFPRIYTARPCFTMTWSTPFTSDCPIMLLHVDSCVNVSFGRSPICICASGYPPQMQTDTRSLELRHIEIRGNMRRLTTDCDRRSSEFQARHPALLWPVSIQAAIATDRTRGVDFWRNKRSSAIRALMDTAGIISFNLSRGR